MDTIISQGMTASPAQLIAQSDGGPRAENQDNYLIIDATGQCEYLLNETKQNEVVSDWQQGHYRLAVADGMGGHNNGRQAAEAVVQALLALAVQTDPRQLREALLAIHNTLFGQFHQGVRTPGSTLVMADIAPNGHAVIANIGDSRAYLYREARWRLLTTDHSAAEFAYRDNEISEAEYAKKVVQNTNKITQAMIFGSSGIIANQAGIKSHQHLQDLRIELEKDVFRLQLAQDDVLMLASDGVWSGQDRYTSPAPLTTVTDLKHYGAEQMQEALTTTRDNVSFVIYRPTT